MSSGNQIISAIRRRGTRVVVVMIMCGMKLELRFRHEMHPAFRTFAGLKLPHLRVHGANEYRGSCCGFRTVGGAHFAVLSENASLAWGFHPQEGQERSVRRLHCGSAGWRCPAPFPPGEHDQRQPDQHHWHGEQLAHGQTPLTKVERMANWVIFRHELLVRLPEHLDEISGKTIAGQKHASQGTGHFQPAPAPSEINEQYSKNEPLQYRLVQLGRVSGAEAANPWAGLRDFAGKDHRPGNVRWTPPQLIVGEVRQPSKKQAWWCCQSQQVASADVALPFNLRRDAFGDNFCP